MKEKPVSVRRDGDLYRVKVGCEIIFAAAQSRIRNYRFGVYKRLLKLAKCYGVDDLACHFRGETIFDVGANVGEFALYAALHGANVSAFEPDPLAFAALARNSRLKAFSAHPIALWNANGAATLSLATESADSSLLLQGSHATVRVKTRRLDTVMEGVDRLYLLKADVEGAEPELLEGAGKALKRIAWISIDCGPERHGERTVDACTKLLKKRFHIKQLEQKRCILLCKAKWLPDSSSPACPSDAA